ncbi:solute carrier family 26 protein [Phaeodactylibacter sp.]|uniref:SulP family inorganic anion transporter n=1 Tax=Phaeodactylibacter sp. TaxID=1940289 RepID=UPI0032F01175
MKQFIPILDWLPKYKRSYLSGDIQSGLTVAIMLVPQGMAYGLLAGLPPIYGLYASLFSLVLYAIFGTSRQLSVGPAAIVSMLVAAGIYNLGADLSPAEMVSIAVSIALLAGLMQLVLGVFRLGVLVNFLSHPVIAGFASAAAFIIAFSQLKHLLGIPLQRSNNIFVLAADAIEHIGQLHWLTLGISLGSVAILRGLKRISKAIPGALVVVLLGTLLVVGFELDQQGVAIIGKVPEGLPAFAWPNISPDRLLNVWPIAMTIGIISFIESVAIAKTMGRQQNTPRIDPNQELIALGITKIGGAFFQAFPTSGSFSRSAIHVESGAKTGISSLISALIITLTLLFFTEWFFYLPKAVLAAIILSAVINLVDYQEARHLWTADRRDFWTMLATFTATLLLGIQDGVLIGVLLSLAIMVYRNSRPHIAVLGQLPNSRRYRSIGRFSNAQQHEEVLIVRFDAQLYFGNADYFRDELERLVTHEGRALKLFILDASSIHDIDTTGAEALSEIISVLQNRNIRFFISGVVGPARDALTRHGLMQVIGARNQFIQIHDAVEYYNTAAEDADSSWTADALQTNVPRKSKRKFSDE